MEQTKPLSADIYVLEETYPKHLIRPNYHSILVINKPILTLPLFIFKSKKLLNRKHFILPCVFTA